MFKKMVVAYDHRVDFKYIERIKSYLEDEKIECEIVEDNKEANDYPLLARKAYQLFLEKNASGMILLCGTGVGMNIVANKCDGIRSVLPDCEASAYFARRDEDANCIVFAAGKSDELYEVKLCKRKMIRQHAVFLKTEFMEEERHKRRINQIADIEKGMLWQKKNL